MPRKSHVWTSFTGLRGEPWPNPRKSHDWASFTGPHHDPWSMPRKSHDWTSLTGHRGEPKLSPRKSYDWASLKYKMHHAMFENLLKTYFGSFPKGPCTSEYNC
jgi:hypothetical protein